MSIVQCLLLAVTCVASGLSAQGPVLGLPSYHIPPQPTKTGGVALADVDQDGDLDLLVAGVNLDPSSQPVGAFRLWMFRNDGNGIFHDDTAVAVPVQPMAPQPLCITADDFDGVSGRDVVIGGNGRIELMQNVFGVLGIASGLLPQVGGAPLVTTLLFDANNDGFNDLFAGEGTSANQMFLWNPTTAAFVAAHSLVASVNSASGAEAADFNGDGWMDLAIASGNGQSQVAINTVGTGFVATNFPGITQVASCVAVEDVNGDGQVDVFLGMHGFQNQLLLNNGAGQFTNVTTSNLPQALDWTTAAEFADVDGDGDADLIWTNDNRQPTRLAINDGQGVFTLKPGFPDQCDSTSSLAVGDVDGDQDVDIVIGNRLGPNRLLLNDGSGQFFDSMPSLPGDSDPSSAAAIGDLDGDGNDDAVVCNGSQGPWPIGQPGNPFPLWSPHTRAYLGDGAGGFREIGLPPVGVSPDYQNFGVAIDDLNGDGRADIALAAARFGPVCGGTSAPSAVLLNLGNTGGTPMFGVVGTYTGVASCVALADVDGNGKKDVFYGDFCGQSQLLLNSGVPPALTLTNVSATALPPGNPVVRACAFGDLTGDGLPDLVLANAGADMVWINQGGTFADMSAVYLPQSSQSTTVAIGDLDADGRNDVVLGSASISKTTVFFNQGPGVPFQSVVLPQNITPATHALALIDFDGDAELDVVIGNWAVPFDGAQYYVNAGARTFTEWSGAPFLGCPISGIAAGDFDHDRDSDLFFAHGAGSTPYQDAVVWNLQRHLARTGVPRLGKPLEINAYGTPGAVSFMFASGFRLVPGAVLPFGTFALGAPVVPAGSFLLDAQGRAKLSLLLPNELVLIGIPLYWQAANVMGSALELTNLEITRLTGL